MASIQKDIPIDASPAEVWAAVRDFGAVQTRPAPGFVFEARLDGVTNSRMIWTVDVLPNEIAPYIDAQMDLAALAMQKKLGRGAA